MLRPDTRYITVRYSCSRFLSPWFAGAEAWRWATTKVGGPPMFHVGSIWLMSDIWVICKGCRCNSTSDIGFNWLLVPGFGAKSFPNSWKKIGTTRPIVRHETRLKLWPDMLPPSWEWHLISGAFCLVSSIQQHPAASSGFGALEFRLGQEQYKDQGHFLQQSFPNLALPELERWAEWWIHKPWFFLGDIAVGYSNYPLVN